MQPSPRVLIVEVDAETRNALERSLLQYGCQVAVADSADGGMQKIRADAFDIVFAGVCIGDKSGLELAVWAKEEGVSSTFYLITRWEGDLESSYLTQYGIGGLVHSPISYSEIYEKLSRDFQLIAAI